jgi:hypothetical protein
MKVSRMADDDRHPAEDGRRVGEDRLETIDLSRAVASREGVSADHMARMQLQYLVSQDRTLVIQTQFADAKAGALMTLMGLLVLRGLPDVAAAVSVDAGLRDVLALLALGAACLCLAACLWAVLPRFPDAALRRAISRKDLYSWPGLASDRFDGEDYVRFMRGSEHGQLVASLARSNSRLAAILLRKFQLVRAAFGFGIAAVGLQVAGAFVAG